MSERLESLGGLFGAAWTALEQKPSREVTLATLSPSGWPEARTVILRAADRDTAVCEVHTDRTSSKMESLDATPRVTLLYWDKAEALQVRMRCDVQILTGEASRAAWDKVPEPSQTAYGKRPPPGTRIEAALWYELDPGPEAFAILRLIAQDIDVLHLGDRHRRAAYARSHDWQGCWLSP